MSKQKQEKEDAVKEKDRTERRSRRLRFVLVNASKQDEQIAQRDEDQELSEDESQPEKEQVPATEEWRYEPDRNHCLFGYKQTKSGKKCIRVSNFEAKITKEIVEDNGISSEEHRVYVLEGVTRDGILPPFEVAANRFESVNFANPWGSKAIVSRSGRSHLLYHIKESSEPIIERRYTHTGWRLIDGKWAYLSAAGALGMDNVQVKLIDEVNRYSLPSLQKNEKQAIKASFSFLRRFKRHVSYPLFVLTYLAAIAEFANPKPNFAAWICGPTGKYKTSIGIIILSHFGTFEVAKLSNFEDTLNALWERAFALKDTVMMVDDSHPNPSRVDAMKYEATAQGLIRLFSNRTGKGRLSPTAKEKERHEPRGMLLITGEQLLSGASAVARTMVIEVKEGDINAIDLSRMQSKTHLLPYAMSSFLLWVRKNVDEVKAEFHACFIKYRQEAFKNTCHAKLPEQVAFMQAGLIIVTRWGVESGAISKGQALKIRRRGWKVFTRIAQRVSDLLKVEDPAELFKEILQTLVAQNRAELRQKKYSSRADAQVLGGGGDGHLIGYFDAERLYLLPRPMWHEINQYCRSENRHFPLKPHALYQLAKEKRVIPSDIKENLIAVRVTNEKPRKMLVVYREGIC